MEILPGKRARSFEEATVLAFQEAGKNDISVEVVALLASTMASSALRSEADKGVKATIHKKYGNQATYYGEQWLIPLPELRWSASPVAQLSIASEACLVSPVKVETNYSSYSITLVGVIGKAQVLAIPMMFLWGLLSNDLCRFRILAKGSTHTTWEVPGAKPVELPNDFVGKLSETLRQKSVGMWLKDFGSQGRAVAPQVVGSLFGLAFMKGAQPTPVEQRGWTYEELTEVLVNSLGYKPGEAKEMLNRAAAELRADYSLEEALRIVISKAGGG